MEQSHMENKNIKILTSETHIINPTQIKDLMYKMYL